VRQVYISNFQQLAHQMLTGFGLDDGSKSENVTQPAC